VAVTITDFARRSDYPQPLSYVLSRFPPYSPETGSWSTGIGNCSSGRNAGPLPIALAATVIAMACP